MPLIYEGDHSVYLSYNGITDTFYFTYNGKTYYADSRDEARSKLRNAIADLKVRGTITCKLTRQPDRYPRLAFYDEGGYGAFIDVIMLLEAQHVGVVLHDSFDRKSTVHTRSGAVIGARGERWSLYSYKDWPNMLEIRNAD